MVLVIDNNDSFTYNLVYLLASTKLDVEVLRYNKVSLDLIYSKKPKYLVISPGPGHPLDYVKYFEILNIFSSKIPILGVCLGHQILASFFGAKVVRGLRPMHGKTSKIWHDGKKLFKGLKETFKVMRYHSLIVAKASLPSCFEISAYTKEGEVMGIRHRFLPLEGVQFHPESILSQYGKRILWNFIACYKV